MLPSFRIPANAIGECFSGLGNSESLEGSEAEANFISAALALASTSALIRSPLTRYTSGTGIALHNPFLCLKKPYSTKHKLPI
jgi:hypothetical protein